MGRKVAAVLVLICFVLVSGCNSRHETVTEDSVPKDLINVTFEPQLSLIYEDNDKCIAEIEFENPTNYDFLPTSVSVHPEIRYEKDGVDTSEANPIFLRGERIGLENLESKKYKYKVEIPKKIFEVYDSMSKERVMVIIEGMFTQGDEIISLVSKGYDTELKLDSNSQWATYTNEILKFKIEYPRDWQQNVWLEPGDTKRFDSYCYGMINNERLKIEFVFASKGKNQELHTFTEEFFKDANYVYSNSIRTNNVPGIRTDAVIEGGEGPVYLLSDVYEYSEDLVLMFVGYLESAESLYNKDQDYLLLEKILDTYQKI